MWHFCLFFLYSSYKCVGVMLKENDYRRRLSKSYFYPWLSLTKNRTMNPCATEYESW